MTLSLSSCFRSCVCPFFFLVSLESIGVLFSLKVFQWCFKKVLRVFQGSFIEISRVFQERFKGVSSMIEESFMEFQGYLKEV